MGTTKEQREKWRKAATAVANGDGWISSDDSAKCINLLIEHIENLEEVDAYLKTIQDKLKTAEATLTAAEQRAKVAERALWFEVDCREADYLSAIVCAEQEIKDGETDGPPALAHNA